MMGFPTASSSQFKTRSAKFNAGFGLVIDIQDDLAKMRASLAPDSGLLGLPVAGKVVAVLGTAPFSERLAEHQLVTVLLRPGDRRDVILGDIERINESSRFLFEGVSHTGAVWEARWIHGAGENRVVEELEIVGPAHVSFENPDPLDGPKSGYLRLNLDGTPTIFNERRSDGVYVTRQFSFDEIIDRFTRCLARKLKFRIGQRVLVPSAAALVQDQAQLEEVLAAFRAANFTSCVVRSFVPGSVEPSHVDVQVLSWPADVPAGPDFDGITYEMPALEETRRFVELRDGDLNAEMEVIPGYMLNLIGNKDETKSTRHKFARDIVRGITDKQKTRYGLQAYGPGISISAVIDSGEVGGLTRLALRTDGPQYRNLVTIPSPHFAEANSIKFANPAGERLAAQTA
jgi:hypothetical protein